MLKWSPCWLTSAKLHHWGHTKKGADVNKKNKTWEKTALYYACSSGKEDIVDVLLDAKADPNICNYSGRSPLMEASEYAYPQIVQKLLESKADISKTVLSGAYQGETALSLAKKAKKNAAKTTSILKNFKTEK